MHVRAAGKWFFGREEPSPANPPGLVAPVLLQQGGILNDFRYCCVYGSFTYLLYNDKFEIGFNIYI